MSSKDFMSFVAGALVGASLVMILSGVLGVSYKGGQIDAINGKIVYHLVVQDNGSSKWELIR